VIELNVVEVKAASRSPYPDESNGKLEYDTFCHLPCSSTPLRIPRTWWLFSRPASDDCFGGAASRINIRENNKRVDYDYKVGDKVLIRKDGILRKAESIWKKEPWTITTVHTNGTIRVQCGTKSERINIRRVTPFSEELLI